MEIHSFFKSVLEQDTASVVICDMQCHIVYMNPVSIQHHRRSLVGQNLLGCHNAGSKEKITKVLSWFKESESNNIVFLYHDEKENKDAYMVALRDDEQELIGFYEKYEYRNAETRKPYEFV